MQLTSALVEERPSWYQTPKVRFITLTFGVDTCMGSFLIKKENTLMYQIMI